MRLCDNLAMKSEPPMRLGPKAGIWSPLPAGTQTPAVVPTSEWTHNPIAGTQTGKPQGGHAQRAISQYLQGTSPVKLSYDIAAPDAWMKDALDKARKAGEVRYAETKQSRASAAVAPPPWKTGLSHGERMAEMHNRPYRIPRCGNVSQQANNTIATKRTPNKGQ